MVKDIIVIYRKNETLLIVSYILSEYQLWQLLSIHVLNLSVNIANLQSCFLNELKFLIMVAYTIFTDPRHERYPLNSIKRSIKCLQHGMFVLFCMLAHVYVFPLTRLPIPSIHFIDALSYNRYICYQVLHTLFLSICRAVVGKVYGYNSNDVDTDKSYKVNNLELHICSFCMHCAHCSLYTITPTMHNMYLCN